MNYTKVSLVAAMVAVVGTVGLTACGSGQYGAAMTAAPIVPSAPITIGVPTLTAYPAGSDQADDTSVSVTNTSDQNVTITGAVIIYYLNGQEVGDSPDAPPSLSLIGPGDTVTENFYDSDDVSLAANGAAPTSATITVNYDPTT